MTDLTEEKIKESKKLSATGRNYIERINQDRYETPEYCIDLIFDQINTENVKSSLEPLERYDLKSLPSRWEDINSEIKVLI